MLSNDPSWTLIIPTFNRTAYLQRGLSYYAAQACQSLRIIIVDSSPKEVADKNLEIIEAINSRHLSVSYIPTDPSERLFGKISKALETCNTQYVGLVADDDILFISRASRYIHTLQDRPDVFSASGMVIKLDLSQVEKSSRWVTKTFPENISDDPSRRLLLQCGWLTTYLWSYYRTHELRMVLNVLASVAPKRWDAFTEYFLYFLMVVMGKITREGEFSYLMVRHPETETAKRRKMSRADNLDNTNRNCPNVHATNEVLFDSLHDFYRKNCGENLPADLIQELRRFFAFDGAIGGFSRLGAVPGSLSESRVTQFLRRSIYVIAHLRALRVCDIPVMPNSSCWLALRDRNILKDTLRYI